MRKFVDGTIFTAVITQSNEGSLPDVVDYYLNEE